MNQEVELEFQMGIVRGEKLAMMTSGIRIQVEHQSMEQILGVGIPNKVEGG